MKINCKKYNTIGKTTGCFLIFVLTLVLSGCYNDNAELLYGEPLLVSCDTVQANFGTDVHHIITNKCSISGCHNSSSAQGGHIFENYDQISGAKDHIYNRVIVERSMPPSGPLTIEEISKIKCWIEGGALNN